MKKILLALSLVALTSAAFSEGLDLSAGGSVGYTFNSQSYKLVNGITTNESTATSNLLSVGAFFDLTYAEVGLGIQTQLGKSKLKSKLTYDGYSQLNKDDSSDFDSQLLNLTFKALGKYPFAFDKITVFPLAGLEYGFNLGTKDKDTLNDKQKSDLNDLFIDLGAGVDYALTDKLYIRGEGLFGLNLTAKPDAFTVDSAFGYKVDVAVSVGYKF